MSEEETSQNSNPASLSTSSWPWGQTGWFLAGLAFCFMSLSELASLMLNWVELRESEGLKALVGLLVVAAIGCSVPATWNRMQARRRGEAARHLPWLRRVNYGLLIAGVSLMMLSLLIPAMYAARAARSQAIADGPWKDHAFAEGHYRISVPASWEIYPDPATPKSVLRLIDRQNDLHLIAIATPKQDLAIHTLADFSRQSVELVTKEATDVTAGDPQSTEVEGSPALDIALGGNFNGVNVVFGFRHIDSSDAWVELRFWATRSKFEAHEATFSRIASSIRRAP